MEQSCHLTVVIICRVHSRPLNDWVRTNFVMLPSVPISVLTSRPLQILQDMTSKKIMTFTIHSLFKHAVVHTRARARFRSLLKMRYRHECFTAVALIRIVMLVLWMRCSDLCGCFKPSHTLLYISWQINPFSDWSWVAPTLIVHIPHLSSSKLPFFFFFFLYFLIPSMTCFSHSSPHTQTEIFFTLCDCCYFRSGWA